MIHYFSKYIFVLLFTNLSSRLIIFVEITVLGLEKEKKEILQRKNFVKMKLIIKLLIFTEWSAREFYQKKNGELYPMTHWVNLHYFFLDFFFLFIKVIYSHMIIILLNLHDISGKRKSNEGLSTNKNMKRHLYVYVYHHEMFNDTIKSFARNINTFVNK